MLNRVLFAADLWKGSTCVSRLAGLRSLGLETSTLDTTGAYASRFRGLSALGRRFYCTPSVRAMNRALVECAARDRPDLVWIEKGRWVYPATLRAVRRHTGYLVGYSTDDLFNPNEYAWLLRSGLPHYDLYLTTNRWNVLEIPRRFGVPAVRAGMGFDRDFHKVPDRPAASSGVLFIGHWEPHTEAHLCALRRAGIPTQVWGHNWRRARDPELRRARPLPASQYVGAIAQAAILLCFLSRWNRNESTGRSFEIPAIGGFLLAERTAEHEYLYGDGQGAALFSSPEELAGKARYYLDRPEERRQIAARGLSRLKDLRLSWQDHMRREWQIVERMLSGQAALAAGDEGPFWPGFRSGQLPLSRSEPDGFLVSPVEVSPEEPTVLADSQSR